MVRGRRGGGLGGLVATAACAGPVANAAASSTASPDAASARAYVRSELGVDRATIAHATAERAAGEAYVDTVAGECPQVRLTVPTKPSTKQGVALIGFFLEVGFSYETQALAPTRDAVSRIASVQQR